MAEVARSKYNIAEAEHLPSPTRDILNLTPHDIFVKCHDDDASMVAFRTQLDGEGKPKSLRLSSEPQKLIEVIHGDIAIYSAPKHYLDLSHFGYSPHSSKYPPIIVSALTAPHIPKWYGGTVLVPDTGPESAIRDEKSGEILGVKRLYSVSPENRQCASS